MAVHFGGGPTRRPIPLVFRVLDAATCTGLAGAVFELQYDGIAVATAVSDEYGIVHFVSPAAGCYTLTSSASPAGYRLFAQAIPVTFDAFGGAHIPGTAPGWLCISLEPDPSG